MNFKSMIKSITAEEAYTRLAAENEGVCKTIRESGCYIWGCGLMGKFVEKQLTDAGYSVWGFIDNDEKKWSDSKKIFSSDSLNKEDVVVFATMYYNDILDQFDQNKIFVKWIYYEVLAKCDRRLKNWCESFYDIFEELEKNKTEYDEVYKILKDDMSHRILDNLIMYRISLDAKYTKEAKNDSLQMGNQDLDKVVLNRINEASSFYDVGGYDGTSTIDFVNSVKAYQKIYFFEPDNQIIKDCEKRLAGIKNIQFVNAAASNKTGTFYFNNLSNGSGNLSDTGEILVDTVKLDDYVNDSNTYIKMDIEGAEMDAIQGMEEAIRKYHPMLSISVYHKAGDIHRIIKYVLSLYDKYDVYMRHYTDTYADSRVYFVNQN